MTASASDWAEYRDMLSRPAAGPAGHVLCPEIGPDAKVFLRRLSVGDVREINAAYEDKTLTAFEKAVRMLPLCLAAPDGTALIRGTPDQIAAFVAAVPAAVARTVIDEAILKSVPADGVAAAKKG